MGPTSEVFHSASADSSFSLSDALTNLSVYQSSNTTQCGLKKVLFKSVQCVTSNNHEALTSSKIKDQVTQGHLFECFKFILVNSLNVSHEEVKTCHCYMA